jgi:hypothetical protein
MTWEAERVNWRSLSAGYNSAIRIPELVEALVTADSKDAARVIMSDIEFIISPSQFLYEAALHSIPLLLASIPRASTFSRPYLIELLQEIACGEPLYVSKIKEEMDSFKEKCFAEIGRGMSLFFYVLETGEEDEIANAIIIIANYVDYDPEVCGRAIWYINKLLARQQHPGIRALLENCLSEINITKDGCGNAT